VGCRLEADVARYSAEVELIMLPTPNAGCVRFEHPNRSRFRRLAPKVLGNGPQFEG
jgi:hypothetical protein